MLSILLKTGIFMKTNWKIIATVTFVVAYTALVFKYATDRIERRTLESRLEEAEKYSEKLEEVLSENSLKIEKILRQNQEDIKNLVDVEDTNDIGEELNNTVDILRRRR